MRNLESGILVLNQMMCRWENCNGRHCCVAVGSVWSVCLLFLLLVLVIMLVMEVVDLVCVRCLQSQRTQLGCESRSLHVVSLDDTKLCIGKRNCRKNWNGLVHRRALHFSHKSTNYFDSFAFD